MSSRASESYQFGRYRVDVDRHAVTRDDTLVAVPPKTFELLLLLVRSPGHAFSKQELIGQLWPGTFVEEANLSFQISTLRKALGHEGAAWIETVPRHGYRFAADVCASAATTSGPTAMAAELPGALVVAPPPVVRPRLMARPGIGATVLVSAASIAILMALRRQPPSPPTGRVFSRVTELTAYQGNETVPSLSREGSQVAFAWNGPAQDNYDIYVKLVGLGEPIRLTKSPLRDDRPAWSPDGSQIAFIRYTPRRPGALHGAELFVVPSLGGPERKIASLVTCCVMARATTGSNLSWTPDGKWLAIGGEVPPGEPWGIFLISADGQQHRRLTRKPKLSAGDYRPTFSPDGRWMAFVRMTTGEVSSVYLLQLAADMRPIGEPEVVIREPGLGVKALAWSPDGGGLFFSTGGAGGGRMLLQYVAMSPATGRPVGRSQILTFGEQATTVTVAANGRVVYSTHFSDTALRRLALTESVGSLDEAAVADSTMNEVTPDYSPDGTRLAFASTRSDFMEIWVSDADGGNPQKMTSMRGPSCGNPDWSRDSQTLLFDSRAAGSSDIYQLHLVTGEIVRLTTDPGEEAEPRWSRDGQWIYFGSTRTGRFEVWKMPTGGGPAVQVTRGGGFAAQESPDGLFLYYASTTSTPTELRRMPTAGGEETLVASDLTYPRNFAVADRGVYLIGRGTAAYHGSIDFIEYHTGRRTTVAPTGKPWWHGVALSHDQKWLLYAREERSGSNLMSVDPQP
jgi:Tol biopolymer transport system component/DNA-binding winged helix-turn-helix (wHTH) protein